MKKLLLFALGALLATSVSARDFRRGQKEAFRFKRGDKVFVIKEVQKGPHRAFKADRRMADFRKEQFGKDFRKKDFRKGPKQKCRKCHKPHQRHFRR